MTFILHLSSVEFGTIWVGRFFLSIAFCLILPLRLGLPRINPTARVTWGADGVMGRDLGLGALQGSPPPQTPAQKENQRKKR